MITYAKVKFTDGDRARTVFLRVSRESARFLSGVEVDQEGEEIVPPGHSQRIRVIEKSVIVSRRAYEMDLKYGELVPAGTGTKLTEEVK